ncbi:MAG: pectinesterase family protein [Prevotellaceae bacterium]|nr:pectinesterase family protein [Prevotellaceae bacterium]
MNILSLHKTVSKAILLTAVTTFNPFITNVKAQSFMKVVATDGTGDYSDLQEAINSCPTDGTRSFIFLRNGTYGHTTIPQGVVVSLIGENRDNAILTHDVSHASGLDKEETSTLYIEGYDFYGENFTTQHTAGRNGGQAECLTNSGDRMTIKNVSMKGNQDAVRFDNASRSYIADSYIEGTVDYIYDSGIAFIDNCDIKQLYPGYIIAPGDSYVGLSRATVKEMCGQNKLWFLGITIRDSRLIRDAENTGDGESYLGRPWGKTTSAGMFIRCKMDKHINEAGFTNMSEGNKKYIGEYQSTDLDGNSIDMSNRIEWEFTEDPEHNSQYIDATVVEKIYDMDFVYTLAGESGARAGGSFDPISMVTPADSPSGITVSDGKFSWNAVANVAGYLLYKDGSYLGNTSSTEFTDDNYSSSSTYTIRSVSATGCLGEEIDMLTSGIAAPTAENTYLTISRNGIFWKDNATAYLYSINGKLLAKKTGTNISWENQPKGCYILRLVSDDNTCINKKVMKQ